MDRHPCPSCERTFDTRRGLGVHHSQTHEERLPNRTCKACGNEFYSDYDKTYCSRECHRRRTSFQGPNNPNYKGGKETGSCDLCQDTFEYYPSAKRGRFCPACVEDETWHTTPNLAGEENPRWAGGKTAVSCDVCGATVRRYPSELTGETVVCGEECRRDWLAEAFSGSGHPNWKGGDPGNYGPGWNAVRKKALARDGFSCVVCGKTKDELGRNPDVHHITPVRWFVESADNTRSDAHFIENVISLCIDCHRKAEFGKIPKGDLRSMIGP